MILHCSSVTVIKGGAKRRLAKDSILIIVLQSEDNVLTTCRKSSINILSCN
jgi:hypothetical protein